MKYTIKQIKAAVQIEYILTHIGDWACPEQLQLSIGSRTTYRGLRFLQEQGIIQSRLIGEGSGRFKQYRITQCTGLPKMDR